MSLLPMIRQISLVSSCFGCFALEQQRRRVGELILRQLTPRILQTREITLESEHCNKMLICEL